MKKNIKNLPTQATTNPFASYDERTAFIEHMAEVLSEATEENNFKKAVTIKLPLSLVSTAFISLQYGSMIAPFVCDTASYVSSLPRTAPVCNVLIKVRDGENVVKACPTAAEVGGGDFFAASMVDLLMPYTRDVDLEERSLRIREEINESLQRLFSTADFSKPVGLNRDRGSHDIRIALHYGSLINPSSCVDYISQCEALEIFPFVVDYMLDGKIVKHSSFRSLEDLNKEIEEVATSMVTISNK